MKKLRDLFPKGTNEALFSPKVPQFPDSSSRDFAKWHVTSNYGAVDDFRRSSRYKNALDRNDNVDLPYRAKNPYYGRHPRYGYNPDENEDKYQPGQKYPRQNVQSKTAGLKGTSVPTVVTSIKENASPEERVHGAMVVDAVAYLREIEDETERNRAAEHFCRLFENTHREFSRSMFFELVNMELE